MHTLPFRDLLNRNGCEYVLNLQALRRGSVFNAAVVVQHCWPNFMLDVPSRHVVGKCHCNFNC